MSHSKPGPYRVGKQVADVWPVAGPGIDGRAEPTEYLAKRAVLMLNAAYAAGAASRDGEVEEWHAEAQRQSALVIQTAKEHSETARRKRVGKERTSEIIAGLRAELSALKAPREEVAGVCGHPNRTRLYGTVWSWCAECGAIKSENRSEWQHPRTFDTAGGKG